MEKIDLKILLEIQLISLNILQLNGCSKPILGVIKAEIQEMSSLSAPSKQFQNLCFLTKLSNLLVLHWVEA